MRRLALALALVAAPAFAVEPDEVLDDPALEARAREISAELRCPVCRNESIDESNSGVSRDLRLMVRERLVAGDSDAEVIGAVVDRYGEFVMLKPDASGANLVLWLAAPLLLVLAGGVAFVSIRRRAAGPEDRLSEEEEARLKDILDR
ncbi:cytochrome c-type biogenesis protein [Limimaricola cinnabarinus]|jgi:cytochrome c-type biogenesis protein CcmH|uniref:Cytochrome c-type biogenesis protein n=1 Tax=Limimaricola cinnabarinus TaxID=1125964 RepID=A0A2G1MF01_9RHOB|nr:cytochrome c-type biogenesis protein [Limimaricola cinnabarinus]PHP27315.1 cytochrome C biogenesis protein CcdA [Limimaricola cinnabarinus]